jgi:hypothetical protein
VDAAEAVAAYGAAWNERDEAARSALLERAWSEDGIYQDPSARAEGRAELVAHIGGFQALAPGHTIELVSGVDHYGSLFRFAWEMRNGQERVLEGVDFGEFADDGRIRRITGFFGPFPDLAP